MKVKTIDILAKEWFDKTYGNSYFAGKVTVNFCMEDEQTFVMPFQYGYGDFYRDAALELLKKNGLINTKSTYELREQGVIIRATLHENCRKRDVMNYIT